MEIQKIGKKVRFGLGQSTLAWNSELKNFKVIQAQYLTLILSIDKVTVRCFSIRIENRNTPAEAFRKRQERQQAQPKLSPNYNQ